MVNLIDRQIEVYTQPSSRPDEPHDSQQTVYAPGDCAPLEIAGQQPSSIKVDDLLP